MGDFNYPEIDWLQNEVMGNSQSDALKLFDCVLENFVFQNICSPTRIRTGQTSNILDLVFTNDNKRFYKKQIHQLVKVTIGLVKNSVIETDTATSGMRWSFHMHSEFSRPAMCNNATMIISSDVK